MPTAGAGEAVNTGTPTAEILFETATFASNATFDTTITAKADVIGATAPVTDATKGRYIHKMMGGSTAVIHPVGTGADNSQFGMRVWRWLPIRAKDSVLIGWRAVLVWAGTDTLCTKVGIAAGLLDNTVRAVDTIAATANTGDRGPTGANQVYQPATADNQQAEFQFDARAASYIEVEMAQDGGTATGFNVGIYELSGT